jgi:hypothetical protein
MRESPSFNVKRQRAQQRDQRRSMARRAFVRAQNLPISVLENTDTLKPGRATAGYMPKAFMDLRDPKGLAVLLTDIGLFLKEHPPDEEEAIDNLASLVVQSHDPYLITVGHVGLSSMIEGDADLEAEFEAVLVRGNTVMHYLLQRLDASHEAPEAFSDDGLQALFFGVPQIAWDLPFARTVDVFAQSLELLRNDREQDRNLVAYVQQLRRRYVIGRSYGDKSVEALFPWETPEWAES